MIRLHGYFRSGTSYRVRIALNLKAVEYESVPVSLPAREHHGDAFRVLNPQSLVPVLETEEGTFTQSGAILEYLEERYPEPALLPRSRADRARVRAWAAIIGADIHPLNNLRVLNHLREQASRDEPQVRAWIAHWIHEGFRALETMASQGDPERLFCFGNVPTFADVYLVPQMYSARRFGVDLSPYPRLIAIDAHCATLGAFALAYPRDP